MGLWRRHGRTWTILRKKKKEGRLEWNNMFKTNTLNYFFSIPKNLWKNHYAIFMGLRE
jgi:hypothetical protein